MGRGPLPADARASGRRWPTSGTPGSVLYEVAAAAPRPRGDEAGAADQRQPVDPHARREGVAGHRAAHPQPARKRMEAVAELNRQGIPHGDPDRAADAGDQRLARSRSSASWSWPRRQARSASAASPCTCAARCAASSSTGSAQQRPDLVPRYERLYARGAYAPRAERRADRGRLTAGHAAGAFCGRAPAGDDIAAPEPGGARPGDAVLRGGPPRSATFTEPLPAEVSAAWIARPGGAGAHGSPRSSSGYAGVGAGALILGGVAVDPVAAARRRTRRRGLPLAREGSLSPGRGRRARRLSAAISLWTRMEGQSGDYKLVRRGRARPEVPQGRRAHAPRRCRARKDHRLETRMAGKFLKPGQRVLVPLRDPHRLEPGGPLPDHAPRPTRARR